MIFEKKSKPCVEALDNLKESCDNEDSYLEFIWFTRDEVDHEKNTARFGDWWKSYKARQWSIKANGEK